MKQEVEVRFLSVDYSSMKKLLKKNGGFQKKPCTLMRRAILDFPDKSLKNRPHIWSWVRVRDEGDHTTVTYKSIAKNDKDFTTHEIEYGASSYKEAIALFEAIGLKKWSEQETKREVWVCKGVEVMFDEWPWIDPYIELEGNTEDDLKAVATILNLDWEQRMYDNTDGIYRLSYPKMKITESIGDVSELTFAKMPTWLKERK